MVAIMPLTLHRAHRSRARRGYSAKDAQRVFVAGCVRPSGTTTVKGTGLAFDADNCGSMGGRSGKCCLGTAGSVKHSLVSCGAVGAGPRGDRPDDDTCTFVAGVEKGGQAFPLPAIDIGTGKDASVRLYRWTTVHFNHRILQLAYPSTPEQSPGLLLDREWFNWLLLVLRYGSYRMYV